MENSEVRGEVREPPLAGWRIVVSRARRQAGVLADALRAQGASVLEIPFIEIRPPQSYDLMDEALRRISGYDWLILTSVNGVEALFERMQALSIPDSALRTLKFVAIGPATKAAIERRGFTVEVTPKEYIAEAVVETLAERVHGKRVLLCRAKIARDVIPRELRNAGAELEVVDAYETVTPESSREQLCTVLKDPERRPYAITFTSSSTVRGYCSLLGIRSAKPELIAGVLNVSIGPVTSATLRECGLSVDVEARRYTIPGLVEALVERARAKSGKPD